MADDLERGLFGRRTFGPYEPGEARAIDKREAASARARRARGAKSSDDHRPGPSRSSRGGNRF